MVGGLRRASRLVVLVSFAGCADAGSELPELEPSEVHLRLGVDAPDHDTGRLIGWNIGRGTLYAPEGDALHPQWRTPQRQQAFALLQQLRAANGDRPVVRFSGLQIDGALGNDGYHFWDFVRPDRDVADDDNMAVFQWMAIVEEIDADPLVMLNFGSGTADEAARYVDHLVGTQSTPEVDARAHWGRNEPYPVQVYEIGNEIYGPWNTGYSATGDFSYANPDAMHGGDPEWHGRPAEDPADYAARALAYADAVTAVDPDARFWIPLSQASMDGWGGLDVSLPALQPLLLDPRIEAVVVHHYQVDDASAHGGSDVAAPELAIAGSEVFRPDYVDLRQRLSALPREVPLQIAVTEYHVAGAFTFGGFDGRADTPLVGLGVADVLMTYARLGIDHANQHMAIAFGGSADDELLFEPWYNPLRDVGGTVQPRPSYVATKLIADHMLSRTIVPEALAMPTLHYEELSLSLDYPAVHAVAFVDDEATEVTAVLLNRDLDASHTVTLDLPADAGLQAVEASAWAPSAWDVDVGDAAIERVPLQIEQGRDRVRVTLPPHALAGLHFQAS